MTETQTRTLLWILIGIAAVLLCVTTGVAIKNGGGRPVPINGTERQRLPVATVTIGGATIAAEVAATPEERARGLSGHAPLSPTEGMLFIFEQSGIYDFWMKDMLFPIDILWLDQELRVVFIAHDVPPESYPATVTPDAPARYVLETQAGFAQAHGIAPGTPARVLLPDGTLLP